MYEDTAWDFINRAFANLDHSFRDAESRFNVMLPAISIPSYTQRDDVRTYSDGRVERHYKNGALHRLDGAAVIEYDEKGKVAKELYFIDGERTTKEAVAAANQKAADEKVYVVLLGGERYTITGKQYQELKKLLMHFKEVNSK